jgi:O-antigen biosynthesis protein WbqP
MIIIRALDIVFSALGLLMLWPVMLLLCVLGWFDTGKPLLLQTRIGRHQRPFTLVKFRTMRPDTAHVASHLAAVDAITSLGKVLRRTKLDELPQLINVLFGQMSLVGPRPCLPSQTDLIAAREKLGVYEVRAGITGLGQLRGIDMSTPDLLAATDAEMIEGMSLARYFTYLLHTAIGKGAGDAVAKKGNAP